MKFSKIRRTLLCSLPVVIFFSYHPVILLGTSDSTNFELSLPLLWLILFSVTSLPSFLSIIPSRLPLLLFPLYTTISALWSPNPLRALLTSGIIWCLLITILTIPNLISNHKIKRKLVKIYLCSTLLVCVICWLQCFLDLLSTDRTISLLCPGCTFSMLGFPRPSGFAIEPQFMGNLLLAPALISLYLLITRAHSARLYTFTSIFIISTLFLTLSRGAIFAFLLACLILTIYYLHKHRFTPVFVICLVTVVSFSVAIVSQGFFAAASPTADTFQTGINKVSNQLTLGHFSPFSEETQAATSDNPTSVFSGYVAESTNRRLDLTNCALDLWDDSPTSVLFGVGLGGSGPSLYKKFPHLGSPKEIVQNEYVSMLLETGITGVALLILAILTLLHHGSKKSPYKHKNHLCPYLLALLFAYAFTLFFFSGLPNALHLYLFPVLYLVSEPHIRRSRRHQKY